MIKEDPHRINNKIFGVNEVRVVGEGVEAGVYPFSQALRRRAICLPPLSSAMRAASTAIGSQRRLLLAESREEQWLRSVPLPEDLRLQDPEGCCLQWR